MSLQKTNSIKIFILISFLITNSLASSQSVNFDNFPTENQLFPRDLNTNLGSFLVSGTVDYSSSPYTSITINTYKNDILYASENQILIYTGNSADFSHTQTINAELSLYSVEVLGVKSNQATTILKTTDQIVAGDAFLINGQSNAYAVYGSSTVSMNSPFIKGFGRHGNAFDTNWYAAQGDNGGAGGFVGQWGITMANKIMNDMQIPIAIINQAQPGTQISFFNKNQSNPTSTSTNYGMLLTRAINAGIKDHVRAIFYYQGESDNNNAVAHKNGFEALYSNWTVDYPSVEHYYVTQVRDGCGSPSLELRNYQRLFSTYLANLTVNTSNGLLSHDGCHFGYVDGYENLGIRLSRMAKMELYSAPNNPSYYVVDVDNITLHTPNQITITTKNTQDNLTWNTNAHKHFILDNSAITITGGRVNGNKIILDLSKNIEDYSEITGLSYNGFSGRNNEWIYNQEEMPLFTFYNEPISYNFSFPRRDIGSGYTLLFDGGNDYVETSLSLPTSYTKEAWVMLKGGGYNNIVSSNNHALYIPSSRLSAGHNGGWTTVRDAERMQRDIWYHVAVSYNSTNREMKLYKNGVLVDQASNVSPANASNNTYIGAHVRNSVFNGYIDEVKIWDTERSIDQIRSSMCATLTNNQEPNLIAYYTFDQSAGNTLVDLTGNYNGTLKNFGNSPSWEKSGAPIGDTSDYNYSSASSYNVNFQDLSISNVVGNAKGITIYYVGDDDGSVSYNDGTALSSHYGVFVSNLSAVNYTSTYNYNILVDSAKAKYLSRTGNDVATWQDINNGVNDSSSNSISSSQQNLYHKQFNIAESVDVIIPNPDPDPNPDPNPDPDPSPDPDPNPDPTTPSINGSGNTLRFDGRNDFVEASLSLPTSYTKEAWVMVKGGGYNNVISSYYNAFYIPNSRLSAGHNGGWTTVRDAERMQRDIWYHVAVSYNSTTREMKLYKNGVLVDQASNVSPAINNSLSAYTFIGAHYRSSVFNGYIDEVKIWDTERNINQIRSSMCTTLTNNQEPNLVAYYTFDQSAGNTLVDQTGNYNGTLKNFGNSPSWEKSGAPIGDTSDYNYSSTSSYNVNFQDLSVSNVVGNAKGITIYYVGDDNGSVSYNDGTALSSHYGVFVSNPSAVNYTSTYNYSSLIDSTKAEYLYRTGNDVATWLDINNEINDSSSNSISSSQQNLYHKQFNVAEKHTEPQQYNKTLNNTLEYTKDIKVFPNPNNGIFNIQSQLNKNSIVTLQIYDFNGKRLYSQKHNGTKGINTFQMTAKNLSSGIYYLRYFVNEEVLATKKIVIK